MPTRSRARSFGVAIAFGLLGTVGSPGTAAAYCRTSTSNCGDSGSGAICTPAETDAGADAGTSCGLPIAWPTGCVGYSIQKDASQRTTFDQTEQTFRAAFNTWVTAPCTSGTPSLVVKELAPAECATIEYNQDKGNANVIMFRDKKWPYEGSDNTIALTTVTFSLTDGAIYDADMELNSLQKVFTTGDADVDVDLLSIATHETGHFLGMAHSPLQSATMYAFYSPPDTSLRTLDPDDIAGMCNIYPPGTAIAQSCDATPRHGFSAICGSLQPAQSSSSGCGVAAPVVPSDADDDAPVSPVGLGAAALGLVLLGTARRGRPRRSTHQEMMAEGDAASEGPSREAPAVTVVMVDSEAALVELVRRIGAPTRIALDVEANGLFAYRPALCVIQIGWPEGDGITTAIVDTLATGVGPLKKLFGAEGPVKVLHDLTFDARMLHEAGVPIVNVRDTSVSARMLGFTATGLAALLASEVGITIDKHFQQHDWAVRPLTPEHVLYLASDVRYLLDLDDRLTEKADALDLGPEIACECAYKLEAAERPPRDARPAYARIKGAGELDPVGRAVLRQLSLVREQVAESSDVPPFKIVGNDVLLELSRRRPKTPRELSAVRGATTGRASRCGSAFLRAIATGVKEGDVPPEDQELFRPARPDREAAAKRRARETQLAAWRRAEAKRRGVNEQAVLPGHCATEVVEAILAHPAGSAALREALAQIPGLGACRRERYEDVFLELSRTALTASRAPAASGPFSAAPAAASVDDGALSSDPAPV